MVTQLEFDRSLLDKAFPAGPFKVTREMILGFCQATGETNPRHTDEDAARKAGHSALVAPPTFCTVFSGRLTHPDIKLNFGRTSFHAGQAIEPLAPIQAGDTLTASLRLKEVYPKTGRTGTMVFSVWEAVFTNQRGEQVAVMRESSVRRE